MRRMNDDQGISDTVTSLSEWKEARIVCLYFSLSDEVDTKPLLAAALTERKIVVFPRVAGTTLELHHITSVKEFSLGSFKIFEPKKSTPVVNPKSVDLFIVPGVLFDQHGNRKGHGTGYYDRLLNNISVPKIGLAYSQHVVAELKPTSYDVSMTMVITEKGVYAS